MDIYSIFCLFDQNYSCRNNFFTLLFGTQSANVSQLFLNFYQVSASYYIQKERVLNAGSVRLLQSSGKL